jgi:hypothetical protein
MFYAGSRQNIVTLRTKKTQTPLMEIPKLKFCQIPPHATGGTDYNLGTDNNLYSRNFPITRHCGLRLPLPRTEIDSVFST